MSEAVAEHVNAAAAGLAATGFALIQLALTLLTSAEQTIAGSVVPLLGGASPEVVIDNERDSGARLLPRAVLQDQRLDR